MKLLLLTVLKIDSQDHISLTDMATAKDGNSRSAYVIKNCIMMKILVYFSNSNQYLSEIGNHFRHIP
ncbi:MAG: hypothetical protein K2K32_03815 [Muribaculaceae bacterium]|nr:hypothetical protein [Muribaculaceae bacterium]